MSCKDCRMKPCTEAQNVECCKDCKTRCSSMCKTAQEMCRKKTTEEVELEKYLESLAMNDRVYSELQSRGIDCVMEYHTSYMNHMNRTKYTQNFIRFPGVKDNATFNIGTMLNDNIEDGWMLHLWKYVKGQHDFNSIKCNIREMTPREIADKVIEWFKFKPKEERVEQVSLFEFL